MAFISLDKAPVTPETMFREETYSQEGLARILALAFTERRVVMVREEQVSALEDSLSIADSKPRQKVSSTRERNESSHNYFKRLINEGNKENVRRLLVARPDIVDLDANVGWALPILDRPDRYSDMTLREVGECLFALAKKWCDDKFGPQLETDTKIVYAMVINGIEEVTNEPKKSSPKGK